MRSANTGLVGRAGEDLTTKARIRDAAITTIGRVGFAAATVRAIAEQAAVSPALLLHHFGSKDGLREACDQYVLDWYAQEVDAAIRDDSAATVIGLIERTPELLPLAAYIRRSLADGGRFARRIFDALVADAQRYLERSVSTGRVRPTDDEHGRALLIVVTSLGAQMLADYLAPPGTTQDDLVAAAAERLTLAGLELYTHGLYADDEYLEAYRRHLDRSSG